MRSYTHLPPPVVSPVVRVERVKRPVVNPPGRPPESGAVHAEPHRSVKVSCLVVKWVAPHIPSPEVIGIPRS